MSDSDRHNAEVVSLLREIRDELRVGNRRGGASTKPGIEPASDRDLDGQYGNPTVRKDPKGWDGTSWVGASFSECPSDYLEAMAGYLMDLADWIEKKDGNDSKAKFKRLDARRAKGWALRNRGKSTRTTTRSEEAADDSGDTDLPF